ncbi:MAG: hypothetical protein AVDCRST_MAG68-2009 [uncultured Gemmatimonadetes bacterium]|uniref:Uncharacterized protein n=1 Tax=uncultured Gemmatimonadota bacterium TaxID=203437 RepID=A0A6J4L6U6_9BACT|nr:MAG: hypothetical protein AVDCRST_MAG68-2009 [uncultured Gemmatimonadota bacterium]
MLSRPRVGDQPGVFFCAVPRGRIFAEHHSECNTIERHREEALLCASVSLCETLF